MAILGLPLCFKMEPKSFWICFWFPTVWSINTRWVSVVEFHDPTLIIGKVFGQESSVVKWNYQILGLHPMTFRQKLGVILGIKLVQIRSCALSRNSTTETHLVKRFLGGGGKMLTRSLGGSGQMLTWEKKSKEKHFSLRAQKKTLKWSYFFKWLIFFPWKINL